MLDGKRYKFASILGDCGAIWTATEIAKVFCQNSRKKLVLKFYKLPSDCAWFARINTGTCARIDYSFSLLFHNEGPGFPWNRGITFPYVRWTKQVANQFMLYRKSWSACPPLIQLLKSWKRIPRYQGLMFFGSGNPMAFWKVPQTPLKKRKRLEFDSHQILPICSDDSRRFVFNHTCAPEMSLIWNWFILCVQGCPLYILV